MTAERSRDTRLELLQEHFSAECDAYQHAGASFIITPLLRQDNDRVTLRIDELKGGRVLITDGGETIDYLRLSGCAVRTSAPFRKRIHAVGASFGVKIEDEEISLEADECDVAEALATVARAAQHMSYLVYYRRTRTVPRFEDRVEAELIGVGARYKRDAEVWGRTGPHRFRFLVNGAGNALLQPLSGTSRASLNEKAERLVFRIKDVREASRDASPLHEAHAVRESLVEGYRLVPPPRFFPVLDDVGSAARLWDRKTVAALEESSDGVIRWSSESPRAALAEALRLPLLP